MHGAEQKNDTPAYRPDIDGLRATAVLLVVLGHAFPQYVHGGFIGVDIFFVISGYLITQIIDGEIRTGRFNIARFYQRRVRRIFPALIAVLIVVFIAGWLLLLPSELIALGKQMVAGAAFSSNLLLYSEGGYFDAAAQTKPLLHLWSLGIEEQFYLVWPLLLLALARFRMATTIPLALIFACSLLANIMIVRFNPQAAFYLPFTRAWELAAGALIAINADRATLGINSRNILALISLAIIAAATALYSPATPYPGIAALAPVAATSVLIMTDGSWPNRFLGNRLAVAIGLISYPLYLWHWPLLTMAALYKASFLRLAESGLIVGVSFLLAALTYRYIERPIRFGRRGKWQSASLALLMTAVASVGALAIIDGFAFRIPEIIRKASTMTVSRDFMRYDACHVTASANPVFAPDCVDASKRPLVLIWGDSTAGMLAAGFRQLQSSRFGLGQFTVNSCPPLFNPPAEAGEFCAQTNRRILSLVTAAHPDVVLLHATWRDEDSVESIGPTVAALRQAGVARIIMIGAVPYWRVPLPRLILNYFETHRILMPQRMREPLEGRKSEEDFKKIADRLDIGYVSAWDALCNADGCLTRVGDAAADLISADTIHLLPKGSRFLAEKIASQILDDPTLGVAAQPQTSVSRQTPR